MTEPSKELQALARALPALRVACRGARPSDSLYLLLCEDGKQVYVGTPGIPVRQDTPCMACQGRGYTPNASLEALLEALEAVGMRKCSLFRMPWGWDCVLVLLRDGKDRGSRGVGPTMALALQRAAVKALGLAVEVNSGD